MLTTPNTSDEHDILEQKRAAIGYLSEAFAEGLLDGLDNDCLAQAALFTAFKEMVETYGEEAAAVFAERLPERIRAGEYSLPQMRH